MSTLTSGRAAGNFHGMPHEDSSHSTRALNPPASAGWVRRVHRVMDYIRDTPAADHRLETLSSVAHSSPFHFHRIFRAIAGETVAEFGRRARLERAGYLMKARPRRTLSSIAVEVGFPSIAEFSRAFKREYGIAPSRWDRRSRLDARPAGADAPTAADWRDLPAPEARIVRRTPCRLAYIRMRTAFGIPALQQGFAEITAWLDRRRLDWRRLPMIGMGWDNYETTPLDRVHYDFGFEVPADVAGDERIGTYELPGFRAVEVHCQGELRIIGRAWDYLYDEWFPRSRYEPADLPAMKRFRRRPDELDWNSWDVDCSIALKPAAG